MRPAIAYLLLVSVYLVYLPHAEFVLDDWPVLGRYQQAREAGLDEQIRVVLLLVQNRFHEQFRFQFLSFTMGYLLWLAVGYWPAAVFAFSLALHAACALALRSALGKLGIGPGPAFLAGAAFILWPAAHGPLLWSHNCVFFLWSTLWFLLYLRSVAASLAAGELGWKAAARQSGWLLLALFSGDPVFGLLLVAAPLAGWFLGASFGPGGAARSATLVAWATVGVAATFYALVINQTPIFSQGVGMRLNFSAANVRNNLVTILDTYRRLSGVAEGSYYELRPSPSALAAAAMAAAAVWLGLARKEWKRERAGRAGLLAAGLFVAAYGPIWVIKVHEFRYDYVPSPYAAAVVALAVAALPVGRIFVAALLTAALAMAVTANIEQCWIPQARNTRAIGERLRGMGRLQPGDLIIVSGTTMWIGTAPHFTFLAGWASSTYAEHVAGVRPLEMAREIVSDGGRLRVYHRNYMRDLKPQEAARTRVLTVEAGGRLVERRVLAYEAAPGTFRLHALQGYAGPPLSPEPYSREQLALAGSSVYFARPFPGHTPVDW